jgi:hypothetical protein
MPLPPWSTPDPDGIDPESWRGREEEGILYVPKAGETPYRARPKSRAAPPPTG